MKEKILSLTKYLNKLQNSLSEVPQKHAHREASYKQFIQWEIAATTKKIAELKLQ
jgi:hypothetical protein